ncbi:MAG: type IX secretion system plug protein domain-containing protein [Melioribacteraceae bacterium]
MLNKIIMGDFKNYIFVKSCIFAFIIFSTSNIINASEPIIKSLQVYVNNNLNSLPVIKLQTSDKLNINFEVESEETPSFAIHFKACDKNWEPYDNLLLQGTSDNALFIVNVEKLPNTTEGANYFVNETFPNNNVHFSVSGNWIFYITDSYDKEIIYEFGKFFVVENIVEIKTDIQNWRREGKISSNNELDRVLNLKTSFTLPDSLDPFRIDYVNIIKNYEINYSQKLEKNSFQTNKSYEWDGAKSFSFITRDLEPGNEYRQIDLNDHNKYQFPNTRAHFDGIEYSRFYQFGKSDLDGSFRLMQKNNQYADYLISTFEFSPPNQIDEDIFIVGSFTNWDVLPWYKLNYDENNYKISLELKRGIYDYQFVSGNIEDDKVENIDWRIFEGNFWETNNKYSIFLYYKSPLNGEYDQIIGFKQILR